MKTFITVLLALCLIAPATHAASKPCLAISGAKVWTGHNFKVMTVVLTGDKITDVGSKVSVTGCRMLNAKGRFLTPGLIDVATHLGLVEIRLEPSSGTPNYTRHDSTRALRASFDVADAYNPRSVIIPVTRLEGVTSVITLPTGGIIAGQGAWVNLAGSSQAEAVKKRQLVMVASIRGKERSRAFNLHTIKAQLLEAASFQRDQTKWLKHQTRPYRKTAQLKALIPVIEGKVPLMVSANRASDIEALLRLMKGTKVKLIIAGGAEAWMVARQLAAAKVPVILNPMVNGPGSFDQIHGRLDNAARLEKDGVKVLISTFSVHGIRALRQCAGNAVRSGLSYAGALNGITRLAADTFGMKGYGIIEAGAQANLVLWTGEPLEISSSPVSIWIEGRGQPMKSRQTELRDRYKSLKVQTP
jgi:imidazolonepropionase-like amidohydrolase